MSYQAVILYSGFWDRPLGFVVEHRGTQFYFSREFDEQQEEYQDVYKVFFLPNLSNDEVVSAWGSLEQKAIHYLCQVPVASVLFDPSFRASIDTALLDKLLDEKSPYK